MGLMVDGKWVDRWYDTSKTQGRFVRSEASFRATLSEAGPFQPEPGRYHLYVSLACPWAHRTLIMRKLKGLEEQVSVSVVSPLMLQNGWQFDDTHVDPLHGARFLYELYGRAQPNYSGRVTVPVLWDKQSETIVNNESAEILRILNSAFDRAGARPGDYYPVELRSDIDAVNARVYADVNDGVYKAGFATTQEAYEEAFDALFRTLDWLEERLLKAPFLMGERFTEADIRLFTTLLRFDAVYYVHFKCNLRRISDYPGLSEFRKRVYDLPGVAETVDMTHIKTHYYGSHRNLNPSGIIPKGPALFL